MGGETPRLSGAALTWGRARGAGGGGGRAGGGPFGGGGEEGSEWPETRATVVRVLEADPAMRDKVLGDHQASRPERARAGKGRGGS